VQASGQAGLSPLWGLRVYRQFAYGLRRGLYSCAASRLLPLGRSDPV